MRVLGSFCSEGVLVGLESERDCRVYELGDKLESGEEWDLVVEIEGLRLGGEVGNEWVWMGGI